MHDYHFFGGGWMMFFWWFLIIAVIIISIKWLNDRRTKTSENEKPLEILKRRYAKGEIDKEEFEERKKELI